MATEFGATETRAYCAVVDSHDCECPPGSVVGRRPAACYACGLDVCRQCSTVIYYAHCKRRCRICFNCQDMHKIGRAAPAPNTTHDYMFPAAILKGIIEHDDGSAYFGSLLGYADYRDTAIKLGWVTHGPRRLAATPLGHAVYVEAHLDRLPQRRHSRAYAWNWDNVKFTPAHLQHAPARKVR